MRAGGRSRGRRAVGLRGRAGAADAAGGCGEFERVRVRVSACEELGAAAAAGGRGLSASWSLWMED